MTEEIKVLIVDDHPFIIEGYKNAITRYNPNQYEFLISQAHDCKSGYDLIEDTNAPQFDIAFLDISMPPYEEKEIFSGVDLAKLILKKLPAWNLLVVNQPSDQASLLKYFLQEMPSATLP